MKKALTICTMLAALCFLAFAGTQAAKQVSSNNLTTTAASNQNVVVKEDVSVVTKADGSAPNTKTTMGRVDPSLVHQPVRSPSGVVDNPKWDGRKPDGSQMDYEVDFRDRGRAPMTPAESVEPYAEIKADPQAYKELASDLYVAPRTARSLDDGGDVCASATVVDALPYCDEGSTVGATADYDGGDCFYSNNTAADEVYVYTPESDVNVTATLGGSGFDTQLYIVTDCADLAGTDVACDDDGGPGSTSCIADVLLLAETTYYIIVDGYSSNEGDYVFKMDVVGGAYDCEDANDCSGPPPVPANDLCENAEAVAIPSNTAGTTLGATDDPSIYCGTSALNQAVWYTVVGDGTTLTASLCNAATTFDTKIQVFTGCCDVLQCVGGNDDFCGTQSEFSWCSLDGLTYIISVGGYSSYEGDFQLDVTSDGTPCEPAEVGECIVDFSVTAPYSSPDGTVDPVRTTCGACDNCDLSASEEHVYEVEIPFTGEWTFSLCNSSYDTKMYIGYECCTSFVENDDNSTYCGAYPASLRSHIECLSLEAGIVYVHVEGYVPYSGDPECGDYILEITGPCTPPPTGRCCYGDELDPDCAEETEYDCLQRLDDISWDEGLNCTDDPCEGVPAGRCCYGDFFTPTCAIESESACLGRYNYISWTEGILNCDPPNECPPYECPPLETIAPECEQAIALTLPAYFIGSTVGALPVVDFPGGAEDCLSLSSYSGAAWFKVTGNGNQYKASLCHPCTDFDTQIRIICDCEALFCVAGDDDGCSSPYYSLASEVEWCTVDGQEYLICVSGYHANEGIFEMTVEDIGECTLDPAICPCWDLELTASEAAPVTLEGDLLATDGNDCEYDPLYDYGADLVVQVTIPADGDWRFSLCGSDFDTRMMVGTDCCLADICFNDDNENDACLGAGGDEDFASECPCYFDLTAGLYYVTIEGYQGETGHFILTVETCSAPQGRCCYENAGRPDCGVMDEATCLSYGGTWTYGIDCSTPCEDGRCCYGPDPYNPSCVVNWLYQCNVLGGDWDEGLDCSGDPPCPIPCPEPEDTPDQCADAIMLATPTAAVPTVRVGSTVGNAVALTGGCGSVSSTANQGAAWYKIVGDGNTFTATTCDECTYEVEDPIDWFDTRIQIFACDCDNLHCIAGNDDYSCDPYYFFGHSLVSWCTYAGEEYIIVVDGYPYSTPEEGLFRLTITTDEVFCDGTPTDCEPCVVECDPLDTAEGEEDCYDDYVDVTNGGCNSDPAVWGSITCGETVCGTSGTFLVGGTTNSRDTDWYHITVTENTEFTWCVTAEFGVLAGIVDENCGCAAAGFIAADVADPCVEVCVTACVVPGTYSMFVSPSGFTGVDCGSVYRGTLTCAPCVEPINPPREPCGCEQIPEDENTVNICLFDPCGLGIIGDDPNPLVIPIPVGQEYRVRDIDVCVDLDHTWDGDVEIQLQSPLGTIVDLSIANGGSGQNYTCTIFDDEADDPIGSGTPPYTSSYQPDGFLSDFDWENAFGNWNLIVFDNYAGYDYGVVYQVCLIIFYDVILPAELSGFDAIAGDREVTLTWETSSETDVDHYTVMRDGEAKTDVTAGGTATGGTYEWTDTGLTNGTEYTYTVYAVDVNGASEEVFTINATPSFAAATVTEYALHQNFPNPFNPGTSIAFDLVDAGFVNLTVYNLLGQEVATVVNGTMNAGRHIVNFTADNLPSGLYLYRIEANGFSAQKKMVVMK